MDTSHALLNILAFQEIHLRPEWQIRHYHTLYLDLTILTPALTMPRRGSPGNT